MKWWYWWNLLVENDLDWPHPWCYRIEAFPEVFEQFCERIGVRPDRRAFVTLSKNIGSKVGNRKSVTWEGLAAADPLLCVKIQSLARSYGYEC